jgi:hypothetical protein
MNSTAPIVLFVYNRPELTRRTVEALAANHLADRSQLIIFSDGPKSEADALGVDAVRDLVSTSRGFAGIELIRASRNQGLGFSIIDGVTRVLSEFNCAVVMEDDLLTSPHFLQYMNHALRHYAEVERVAAISGYVPPVDVELPETFFLQDAECWGWATWRRAWSLFEADGARLLAEIRRRGLAYVFDQESTYPFVRMLENQIAGRNSSWAVRWRACVLLNDKLSLYPGRPLVDNIGFDGSGTHCNATDDWRVRLSTTPVRVSDTRIHPCREGLDAFKRFNRKTADYSLADRIVSKIKRVVRAKMQPTGTA